MKIKEILKDPASYIWTFIDKKRGKEVIDMAPKLDTSNLQSSTNTNNTYNFNFMWLFRGKSGVFLAIFVPLIIILTIIGSVIQKPTPPTVTPPPVVDPGDVLETPDFVSNNYLTGVTFGETNLLYSRDQSSINEIGLRGVVLSSSERPVEISYYFPITKTNRIYFSNNSLIYEYLSVRYERQYGSDVEIKEDKQALLLEGVASVEDIKGLKLTSDENIAFTYNDKFYVFDKTGEKIDEIIVKDNTSLFSYYNGEVYYVERTDFNVDSENGDTSRVSEYTLVRLNSNKEVIYRQDLGGSPIHNLYILNNDRYLLLFERPSEKSFFFVQMKDADGRTLFGFTPDEKVQKITIVNHLYFSPENNTILMVGGGIAKLFTSTGKQLWIN